MNRAESNNNNNIESNPTSCFKQYDRIRILGKGSFGTATVYRRRIDCALIVFKEIDLQKFQRSEKGRQQAIQEARIMSNLSHNNIIKYFNAYTDGTKLIIEMEYASIGTLQAYLSYQNEPLEEQEILVIFRQIASGLDYLHSKSIIHLDLKMANIFVTGEGLVKIGDFGIAQIMEKQDDPSNRNVDSTKGPQCKKAQSGIENTTHQLGTLAYSSPERCLGEPTDFKSDIWSLGCILYELVESKPLFSGESLPELVLSITRIQHEPMQRQNIAVELRMMFARTVERNPSYRPSAFEMVDICDRLLFSPIGGELTPGRNVRQSSGQKPLDKSKLRVGGNPINHAHKQRRRSKRQFDLSTEAAFMFMSSREHMNHINYPYSLVYQVRLDTANIKVERVNLPLTKRIKEMTKGRSHYLVLTYDNVVYGWGSKHCGQLGACNLTSSANAMISMSASTTGRSANTPASSFRSTRSGIRGEQTFDHVARQSSAGPSLASSTQTIVTTTNLAGAATTFRNKTRPKTLPGESKLTDATSNQQVHLGSPSKHLSKRLIMDMLRKSRPTSKPFAINELNNRKIIQLAAGNDFSVFLSKTGIVMTCGSGASGCLGRGELADCFTPSMVDGLLSCDIVNIASGPKHVVAVCGNGRAFAWGKLTYGRLGILFHESLLDNHINLGKSYHRIFGLNREDGHGDESSKVKTDYSSFVHNNKYVTTPQRVNLPENVFIESAYCGERSTIFIDSENRCWACGENWHNKLGLDVKRKFKRTLIVNDCWLPLEVEPLSKYHVVSCSIGKNHTSFLTSDGKALVLGQDIDHSYKLKSNILDGSDNYRQHLRSSTRSDETNGFEASSFSIFKRNNSERSICQQHMDCRRGKGSRLSRVNQDYLIKSLLFYNQLADFKYFGQRKTCNKYSYFAIDRNKNIDRAYVNRSQDTISEGNLLKFRINKYQKRQIESFMKKSRCLRKVPFEYVISMSCTSKFTLLLTNDNRVYFWGTRSYQRDTENEFKDDNASEPNQETIESQLIPRSLDECFIKIGRVNNSLMSNIQLFGSDQPIIQAQDPKLIANSLSDLWILDYHPIATRANSNSSLDSSQCESEILSTVSRKDSVWSDCSNCTVDCSKCSWHTMDYSEETQDTRRHDAVLNAQPVVSLYIPSMFNQSSGYALHLVNLFCSDEDKFYLVLDTTIKFQHSHAKSTPRLDDGRGDGNDRGGDDKTAARRSLSSSLRQQQQQLNQSSDSNREILDGRSIHVPSPIMEQTPTSTSISIKHKDEFVTKGIPAQPVRFRAELDAASATQIERPHSGEACDCCPDEYKLSPVRATTHNNSSSLDEPRSFSTLAATLGQHVVIADESTLTDHDGRRQPRLRPIGFENHDVKVDETTADGPSLFDQLAGHVADRIPRLKSRRQRRSRSLITRSESATFDEKDDTSSMPSWVRNEYMEYDQNFCKLERRQDQMFSLDASSSSCDDSEGTNLTLAQSNGSLRGDEHISSQHSDQMNRTSDLEGTEDEQEATSLKSSHSRLDSRMTMMVKSNSQPSLLNQQKYRSFFTEPTNLLECEVYRKHHEVPSTKQDLEQQHSSLSIADVRHERIESNEFGLDCRGQQVGESSQLIDNDEAKRKSNERDAPALDLVGRQQKQLELHQRNLEFVSSRDQSFNLLDCNEEQANKSKLSKSISFINNASESASLLRQNNGDRRWCSSLNRREKDICKTIGSRSSLKKSLVRLFCITIG